jgi:organic radical activating enzyme
MTKLKYPVVEIFHSIQGEGIDSGLPAQFIRLSGCNRHCSFCDTRHDIFSTMSVRKIVMGLDRKYSDLVVITGGEPLLHDIRELVFTLKRKGYRVGIETNGTRALPNELYGVINSISLSPKVSFSKCRLWSCDSLKILYPFVNGITPSSYNKMPARRRYLQPIDFKNKQDNEFCIKRLCTVLHNYPDYRIGLQIHKYLNIN